LRSLTLAAALLLTASLALPARAAARSDDPIPAPGFRLPTRDAGAFVSLDSLRGRVVLVDFWASWCAPCHRSFPWLASLHQRFAGRGLAIVAIDLDKDRDAADAFLAGQSAPFTVAFDPAGRTAEAYRVAVMPSSYLVDAGGRIVYAHAGFDPKRTATIESLIEEAIR
jgi:thiol-disulfide isomerase/thioredoxin